MSNDLTVDGHRPTCPAVVWSDERCTCTVPAADDYDMTADWWSVSRCPACGDPIDYCQGHGPIGDPVGHLTLKAHDKGKHEWCNAFGCEEVRLGK